LLLTCDDSGRDFEFAAAAAIKLCKLPSPQQIFVKAPNKNDNKYFIETNERAE